MKFVDEYRDSEVIKQLLGAIKHQLDDIPPRCRPWQIMEVCGGHTRAIYRFGLDKLLPKEIEFIHGPGCPVCVLPIQVIDQAFALALKPDVILCSYGDVMRVPGSSGSLIQAREQGADVRIVYSPRDALAVALNNPERQVVFLAIGFETTIPATAATLLAADKRQVSNFHLLVHHVCIEPPLLALLEEKDTAIDAFIAPGHVSTITGALPYLSVAATYHKPVVISGFEPADILQSTLMLLRQLQRGKAEVENQYTRAVQVFGNRAAQTTIDRVFELAETTEWRGLGKLRHSGYQLVKAYQRFDATRLISTPDQEETVDHTPCHCADVLCGKLTPDECPLFGRACKPTHPAGALMVSEEGACAAHWQYRQQEVEL
ncbi:hydrogenase formation protein HypD [Corallincola platygyrae]|uniref:Hydrogenase maturation factor n=1 Tax=Corallincola platygyrae TaxID=1193278 RepID=A0ABW4XKN1_9GAMM